MLPKILMIVGSLRKDSFNRQMAGEIEKYLAGKAEISYLDYASIPYMNQDIEFPAPAEIERVRREVQAADGIWICTAEYNFNIPGVLKNLLDWLSRPLEANNWEAGTAIAGKTVTISGAGGKAATRGVRKLLAQMLSFLKTTVVAETGTGIALDPSAFATGKATFSEEDLAALKAQADQFLAALTAEE